MLLQAKRQEQLDAHKVKAYALIIAAKNDYDAAARTLLTNQPLGKTSTDTYFETDASRFACRLLTEEISWTVDRKASCRGMSLPQFTLFNGPCELLEMISRDLEILPGQELELINKILRGGFALSHKYERCDLTANEYLARGVTEQNSSIVGYLLKHHTDPNTYLTGHSNPLIAGIRIGDVAVVTHLLKHGADPNFVGEEMSTPLIETVWKQNLSLTSLLVESGADPNFLGPFRWTPLIKQ